jgi:Lrp/AsnC family transcriptional regulator for asnA, asnC and gidA
VSPKDLATSAPRPGGRTGEVRLTPLEAAVFRALQEDGRAPFTAVAERLGVTEASVRRTVRRLMVEDVFTITAVADPRLFGLESMAWLTLSVRPADIEATAAALAGFDEIDYVVVATGAANVMAEAACADTDACHALVQRIRALPGVRRTETFPYFAVLHQQFRWTSEDDPAASLPARAARGVRRAPPGLGPLDRKLIGELEHNGRASFRELGDRLGVSERAVSARFTELSERDALRVIAVGNPHALAFDGLAWLGITLEDDADLDDVADALAAVAQLSYLVSVSGRFDLMGELVCRDRDHLLTTLEDRIGRVRGIAAVEIFYYLRLLYRTTCGAWGAARSRAVTVTTDARPEEVRPVRHLR